MRFNWRNTSLEQQFPTIKIETVIMAINKTLLIDKDKLERLICM